MRSLLLRLSALDAEAEGAVRVIAVFDALLRQHVGLATLARTTARLAECPVGVTDAAGRILLRSAPDGHRLAAERPESATSYRVDGGGEVWLERTSTPLALDDIVLERFATAVAIVRELQLSSEPRLGDPALVELAISRTGDAPNRSRALHLMGLNPATPIRALAVAGDASDVVARCAGLAGHAPIQELHAVLVVGDTLPPRLSATPGTRIGVGPFVPADEAWRSWRCARLAVRFADAAAVADDALWLHGGSVVCWDELGGFAALAEHVPVEAISEIPDVQALDHLAAARGGAVIVATLHGICLTDSLRPAGTAMHLHHSSVAARLARAEEELGFTVRTAPGRTRLALALTLRHLHEQA